MTAAAINNSLATRSSSLFQNRLDGDLNQGRNNIKKEMEDLREEERKERKKKKELLERMESLGKNCVERYREKERRIGGLEERMKRMEEMMEKKVVEGRERMEINLQ